MKGPYWDLTRTIVHPHRQFQHLSPIKVSEQNKARVRNKGIVILVKSLTKISRGWTVAPPPPALYAFVFIHFFISTECHH